MNQNYFLSSVFSSELEGLDWPKETWVDFDMQKASKKLKISLDINLPESKLLPKRTAEFNSNQKRLKVKAKSKKKCQHEYATHVHAILFRLTGVSFAVLPALDEVIISGYTQVVDKKGCTEDVYILSLQVKRKKWETINFDNLESIDPIDVLTLFKFERKMNASFMFKEIKPWI